MPDYFHYTGPLNPEDEPEDEKDRHVMIWREELLRQLLLDIHNVDYPLIYGPCQTGKTTVAMQLIYRLARERPLDYLPVFLECGTLAGSSSRVVAHKLECTLLAALRGYLARLKQQEPGPAWDSVTLPDDPWGSESDFYRSQQIMQTIPKQLPKLERLVLVVDEIESLKQEPLYETLANFRSLHQDYQKVESRGFACCVVITCRRNLAKLELGPGSPYNIAVTRYVPDLGADKWREAVSTGSNVLFSEEALGCLFREVSGQPYLLQRVSDLAHRSAQSDGVGEVAEQHVLSAIVTLSREGDRLLSVLASAVDERPERQDVVRRLLCDDSSVSFDRMVASHKDLSEAGLLVNSQGRLAFRNRVYERIAMTQQYREMNPPPGARYLRGPAALLPGISEVQFAVMNHDLREEVFAYVQSYGFDPHRGQDVVAVAALCEEALEKSDNPIIRDLDVEFIKAALEYATGETASDATEIRSIALKVIARLLAEVFVSVNT